MSLLLSLIYINDLSDDLSNVELFTDDTSLFSVVLNVNTSADQVSNDLVKIDKWTYQQKISFNPDPIKQAQKILFIRKTSKEDHPQLVFEQITVYQKLIHKNS